MKPAAVRPSRRGQAGLTLIELLVACIISTLVAIAAVVALSVSRQGFWSVDAASQLRDNARFAVDLLQRVGVQAGFRDVTYAATPREKNAAGVALNPDPPVFGFNNAMAFADDPGHGALPRGAGPGFGSDVLIVRYQNPETFPGSGQADQSVIDCLGRPAPATAVPTGRDSMLTSVLHVALHRGEPSLMCTTVDAAGVISEARPVLTGVDTFQVLYGVDGYAPAGGATEAPDSVAERYVRADELDAGAAPATYANWRKVRSLRIGLVLRGPVGSAVDRGPESFYPLGKSMWAAADPGSKFDAPADGRLRHVVTFTIHLRNDLGI